MPSRRRCAGNEQLRLRFVPNDTFNKASQGQEGHWWSLHAQIRQLIHNLVTHARNMPPRRSNGRSAAGPKKSQQQSTLSFGAKSRITKPTTSTPGKPSKSVSEPAAKEIIAEATTPETPASPELSEEPIPPVTEEPQPQTEEERRALQITDAQLRKYWSNEEKSRKTPRGRVPFYMPAIFLGWH